jgi:hypothetical protein
MDTAERAGFLNATTARIVAINFLVLVLLLSVLELVVGDWLRGKEVVRYNHHCLSELYHHTYCNGVTYVHTMSKADGSKKVVVYVNGSGIRVEGVEQLGITTDTNDYDVINIGDSFMQAPEVEFPNALSSVMSRITGKKVLQVGFSSWAPIQYLNYLRNNEIREEAVVNVFLFTNDLMPSATSSNMHYRKQAILSGDGLYRFPDHAGKSAADRYPLPLWKEKSAIWGGLRILKRRISDFQSLHASSRYADLDEDYSEEQTDCSKLAMHQDVAPLTYDYLAFAFSEECWSEEMLNEVDSGAEDLFAIRDIVEQARAQLNVFLIPAGWALRGELMLGRAAASYRIGSETVLTSMPLVSALNRRGIPVISLEGILNEIKEENENELLYFPADGHWTSFAHLKIGEWLSSDL